MNHKGRIFLIAGLLCTAFLRANEGTYSLAISEHHSRVIAQIIETVAGTSTIALGFKKHELENLGHELDNRVDVYQFLYCILSDPKLRHDLHKLSGTRFKWYGFMRGVNRGLNSEKKQGTLMSHYTQFISALGLSPGTGLAKLNASDWDGFVRELLKQLPKQ